MFLSRMRADLTDSVRELDNELSTLRQKLKAAHQKETSMSAILRTAEVSIHLPIDSCIIYDSNFDVNIRKLWRTVKQKDSLTSRTEKCRYFPILCVLVKELVWRSQIQE